MKIYKIINEWLKPNRPVVGHLTYRIVPTQKHDTSDAKWRPHFFSLLKVRHFTIHSVVAFMSTDWLFIQRLWSSRHIYVKFGIYRLSNFYSFYLCLKILLNRPTDRISLKFQCWDGGIVFLKNVQSEFVE